MNTPELLLPAGGFERMVTAFNFGADAVYAGQPRYSLRARNNEFSKLEELKKGIDEAHKRGKKFYLASNIIAHNAKVKTFLDDLKPVAELNPDALIMSDAGLIMLAREHFPDMDIHLSVQANTTNWQAVKFWQNIGISRIILSRELSMDEIAEIRQHCPDIELEVFVHGALCIAYSGRCLLSGYFNHRDPNQGTCTNACRWQYSVNPAEIDDAGNAIATAGRQQRNPQADKIWLIEEENRTGEHLPIMEDEHGTYIMNSKDLRAVEQIEQLIKIGVDSLKIEGRTKSVYYVARTAQTYRRAIDDALRGKPFNPELLADLEGLANRGYTSGFLERHRTQDYQNYLYGHSIAKRSQYVGKVLSVDENGVAEVEVKNRFEVGDTLEIINPNGNSLYQVTEMKKNNEPIEIAHGNGIEVKLPNMQGKENSLLARILPDDKTDKF